jgi:hypothetical protein
MNIPLLSLLPLALGSPPPADPAPAAALLPEEDAPGGDSNLSYLVSSRLDIGPPSMFSSFDDSEEWDMVGRRLGTNCQPDDSSCVHTKERRSSCTHWCDGNDECPGGYGKVGQLHRNCWGLACE